MQAPRNDYSVLGRQHGVAGKSVGLAVRVGADPAHQGQFPKAAGDRDRLVAIGVDHRGEKNAADTGRSAAHPAARIEPGARVGAGARSDTGQVIGGSTSNAHALIDGIRSSVTGVAYSWVGRVALDRYRLVAGAASAGRRAGNSRAAGIVGDCRSVAAGLVAHH